MSEGEAEAAPSNQADYTDGQRGSAAAARADVRDRWRCWADRHRADPLTGPPGTAADWVWLTPPPTITD